MIVNLHCGIGINRDVDVGWEPFRTGQLRVARGGEGSIWCQERWSFINFQKDASPSSQNPGIDNISPSFRARQLRRPRNRRIVASLFLYDAARKALSYMLGIVDLSVPHAGYSRGNYYRCRPEENS